MRLDPPEPDRALENLDQAAKELELIGSEVELARCEFETGRAYLLLGDADAAERRARAGLERLDEAATLDLCNGQLLLGDALSVRGAVEEAHAAYRWAADMLGMMSAGRESAAVWRALGDRLRAHGDVEAAAEAYERALSEAGIRATAAPALQNQTQGAGASQA
ncbi:hypothetical protein N869_02555 [Cellulomonas bogoriensis 69B4 = DSM 16987]|uniref:Tetratricopeptide repeat protein n=1 Tax=Cellulomonas bogoriensis 69B4 = DSM 16987 TaxID=1386082 RepID=A0A0A0BTH7_9CELL|nr:hypothetical protein N869_02555 [Cellulomonas bogoriensis 69B4 = DSM 16987]